ncbi:MAG: HAD-IA family hydrolase [bacterium]
MPAPARPDRRRPTILFDLDGTLIDSLELILNSARYAFNKLERVGPSDEEWLSGVGIPLVTMLRRYARDDADVTALLAAYREYQMANHDRLTRCYDAAVDTVRTLHERGHDIGIVTSKSESLALRGLAHVGLARYMDTIVGCDSCTRHKPDPEPVRIALHRLDCLPEHALFVGDSVFDVLAGNAAGVETAAALWGAATRAELEPGVPNAYLEHMSELPGLVDQWTAALPTG